MPIITDANVLIDYVQSDLSVLGMYGLRIERVVVPASVLAEVRQLSGEVGALVIGLQRLGNQRGVAMIAPRVDGGGA